MEPAADGPERDHEEASQDVSRRRFLHRSAAAGSAAVVAGAVIPGSEAALAAPRNRPGAPPAAPLSQQREMLLQAAKVGAVYPYESRDRFGESGRARDRATMARLLAAEKRMSPQRLEAARAGTDALIAQGLLGAGQARMLDGIGRYAAGADPRRYAELTAAVALGAATLFARLDPNSDAVAKIWLGGLCRVHRQGRQPRPIGR